MFHIQNGSAIGNGGTLQDEESMRLLTKLFRYMIICTKIFIEINPNREET